MKRIKRPLAGLALLGAASVAVVAAATVWLYTGWTTIGLTLTDRIGSGAQELQGFTLEGALEWHDNSDSLYFRLQDGALHTEFWMDKRPPEAPGLSYWPAMVVPAAEHAPADGKAFVSEQLYGGLQILRTYAPALQRTYTYTLPDDTTLRLAGETVTMQEEVPVTAMTGDLGETDSSYDYTWQGETQNGYDAQYDRWQPSPAAENAVRLGDGGYALCWRQEFLGRAPGLYRAHGLTREEIAALPRDGTVHGKEVLCASTEFGALTPFYCPADARTALAGAAMEGGFTLLLYLDGEDTLWADLVTAAGQRADHRELGALPAADLYDATLMPRTATREAVVSVLCNQAVEGGGYVGNGGVLAALRVENGRFTVARTLENDGAGADAAVLNEAGDAVLTADVLSNTYQYWGNSMGQTLGTSLSDHVRLKVYDLTNGNMTYQGMLHTGDDAAWLPEEQPRPSTIFIFSIETQEAAP